MSSWLLYEGNRLLELSTVEEYMNICMDGISHKSVPGPESDLFNKVGTVCTISVLNTVLSFALLTKFDINCPPVNQV